MSWVYWKIASSKRFFLKRNKILKLFSSFNLLKDNKIKTVGMTDVSSGIFGIPAKLGREIFIKCLLKYIFNFAILNENSFLNEQKEENLIENFKIIHHEFSTVLFFKL